MTLPRTKQGTILELLCASALIISWAVSIVGFHNGKVSVNGIIGVSIMTLSVVVLLAAAYKPRMKWVNFTFDRKLSNHKQYHLNAMMLRLVALWASCSIILKSIVRNFSDPLQTVMDICFSVVIAIIVIYFTNKINEAG